MQFAIAIFTIGVVLVLIELVGGDLFYRGLTVPKVGPLPRFTTVTGGVFLAFSLVVFLVAEFGHDPVALDPGTTDITGAGVVSETTTPAGVEAVT